MRQNFPRSPAVLDLDAFFDRLLDLGGKSRHLGSLFQADEVHFFGPQLAASQGRIHGSVPAPDHDHALPHLRGFTLPHLPQKIQPLMDFRQIFARDSQGKRRPSSGRQ